MEAVAPTYLMTMPLHAITEVYGEAGLRQRFALEISRFPDAARERLEEALALAAHLHRRDRRTREPYLNHLLRSAIRVMHHYRVDDVDVIVATLLHDAVEDHPEELARGRTAGATKGAGTRTVAAATTAALEGLAERFGPRVASLVHAVTNPEWDPGRDSHEQYRDHVAHSLAGNPWARVIKVSDFTDNGVGLIHTSPGPRLRRLASKYRPLVPILRELIARPDTPLSADVKAHVYDQLDLAEERFDAILAPSPRDPR
jgi:hypothetical protein